MVGPHNFGPMYEMYETFMFPIDDCLLLTTVFVPGEPKRASLRQAPALFTDIRLGWKGLPMSNTIVYYKYL